MSEPCSVKRGLNSLPNDKILELTKLKAFADDKFNVSKMMRSVSNREENIVGKGENAGNQHFLLFPTMFSNAFFYREVKNHGLFGKGLTLCVVVCVVVLKGHVEYKMY